jgi:hypothetical protein
MAVLSRYKLDSRLSRGSQFGTAEAVSSIRQAIRVGSLQIISKLILTGDDRLDTLAGSIYGDAKYWWVLAASSNIGWGMQVPAGTQINIVDIRRVAELVG